MRKADANKEARDNRKITNCHNTKLLAGVLAGDTQASPFLLPKEVLSHFRIGRTPSNATLTNRSLPQYSRVL